MDKVVTRYFKIGTIGFVLAKVLGDELLFGPIHVGGYFAWMTLAEGGSLQVCSSTVVVYICTSMAARMQHTTYHALTARRKHRLCWS